MRTSHPSTCALYKAAALGVRNLGAHHIATDVTAQAQAVHLPFDYEARYRDAYLINLHHT